MGQQGTVVVSELMTALAIQVTYARSQIFGAMPLRNITDLPQAGFQAFGQRLKAFRETDPYSLNIGVGQHEVIHQVRKWHAGNRHPQCVHRGEIGLRHSSRHMLLLEHDFLFRAMPDSPGLHMALQRA